MPRNSSYIPATSGSTLDEQKAVFGERVRSLMNAAEMNQSDLARAAGLKRDAVSTYINAKRFPDPKNLAKLARALGVKTSQLVDGLTNEDVLTPALRHSQGAGRTRALAGNPPAATVSVQADMTAPGMYHLRLDQEVDFPTLNRVLTALAEYADTAAAHAGRA